MNIILETFARTWLKDNLAKCKQDQQVLFKRMFAFKYPTKATAQVIDDIVIDQLDSAMMLVERTLEKNRK